MGKVIKLTLAAFLLVGVLAAVWIYREESACEKARELYRAETKIYQQQCYVKHENKWVPYDGVVYVNGGVSTWWNDNSNVKSGVR